MKTLPRFLLVAASLPGIAYAAEPSLPQGVIPEKALTEAFKPDNTSQVKAVTTASQKRSKNKTSKKLKECEKELEKAQAQQVAAARRLVQANEKLKVSVDMTAKVKSLETEVQRLRNAKVLAEKQLVHAQTLVGSSTKSSVRSKTKGETNPGSTLAALDKYLATASQKTKTLESAIKNVQNGKALAEQRAKKTGAELFVIRREMEMVTRELANMKKRDSGHRDDLKQLEIKLATVSRQATSESAKLKKAVGDLANWEARAKRAEIDLAKTKDAMQSTMRFAADTKVKNQQFQEKLTLSAVSLAQRDSKVANSEKLLAQAKADLAKYLGEISTIKSQLVTQRENASIASKKLKAIETERTKLANAKAAADKALAKVNIDLVTTKKQADKVAILQKQVDGYTIELAAKSKEADQVKGQFQQLTSASKKVKERLDITLLKREELHDNLTILRNEFAQYRIKTAKNQTRMAQESTSILQAALAKKDRDWQAELDKWQQQVTDLTTSLKAKEIALQDAYKREKSALAKVSAAKRSSAKGGKERQALQVTLDNLRRYLASSEKQAGKLKEQLEELEVLAAGTAD